ncbi:MAG: LacI family DNA-binding transcriptional regulator [Casimicrobium sp.]
MLARNLGLSNSTVSRALNGYADVNAETRKRVEEEAARIGYRPNPVAHRLATGKTNVIGLVTSVRDGIALDTGLPSLLAGLSEVLRPQGYTIIATGFPLGEAETEPFTHFVRGGFVDALILVRTRPNDARVDILRNAKLPFVTYGRTLANDHAWIDNDNESAFYLATKRLLDFGHRRIALLNATTEFTFARLREDGYRRALKEAGIAIDETIIAHGELNAGTGFESTDTLLSQANPPSAFVCVTDSIAIGVMAACRKYGKVVGRDVSIIGYGNSDASRYAFPTLTTIEQSTEDVGHKLADFVLRRLRGEDAAQLQLLESVRIVARESDGPLTS